MQPSHSAFLIVVLRGGGACGGLPQNKTALPRKVSSPRSLDPEPSLVRPVARPLLRMDHIMTRDHAQRDNARRPDAGAWRRVAPHCGAHEGQAGRPRYGDAHARMTVTYCSDANRLPQARMSRMGGERAYRGRLGKGRSPRHCRHSFRAGVRPARANLLRAAHLARADRFRR
jgi:hypothetical protein